MTEHITTCVHCHGELPEDQDAYCSDACRNKNESPKAGNKCKPSWYQMLRSEEETGVPIGEQ